MLSNTANNVNGYNVIRLLHACGEVASAAYCFDAIRKLRDMGDSGYCADPAEISDAPDEIARWPYSPEGLAAAQAELAKHTCDYWIESTAHNTYVIMCDAYALEYGISHTEDDDGDPIPEEIESYDYDPAEMRIYGGDDEDYDECGDYDEDLDEDDE